MAYEPAQLGLGRWPAPDDRDTNYLLRAAIPEEIELPTWKYWHAGTVLDQGSHPHCVGFSWAKFLQASPLNTHTGPSPESIYYSAQKVDQWPGEAYDGTSVRAGVKVLQSLGHIAEYRWSWRVEEIAEWLLTQGTVVLGTLWPRSYFYPDASGFVRLDLSAIAGGHAYVAVGYSEDRGAVRCLNSWSAEWGDRGRFWIPAEDLQQLLDRDGEAAVALERKL